ncbi:MAG: hypothetical protein SFW08_13725, partial [Gemmatimonadaceae bacterium]|nr:hypothetical protein [Gemmatimonadaceae bacterium]
QDAVAPTVALGVLIVGAVLFTIRLKYGEWIVLQTFCPWCQVNTVVVLLDLWLVTRDWRRVQALRAAPPGLVPA